MQQLGLWRADDRTYRPRNATMLPARMHIRLDPWIPPEGENEIPASHVVGEISEELIAKRIIAQVLNDCSAVGIGLGLEELLRSGARKSPQEHRHNTILPRGIDNSFM